MDPFKLLGQLEEAVRKLAKGGPVRDVLLGFFFISAAGGIPMLWNHWNESNEGLRLIMLGLGVIGIIFLSRFAIQVWKIQKVTQPESSVLELQAIRGPLPFSEDERDLFVDLKRDQEIKKLLSWARDTSCPVFCIRGQSGAGKTSLLAAGLIPLLIEKGVACQRLEVYPKDPLGHLERSLGIQRLTDEISSIAQGIFGPANVNRLIVLDQVEQLDPFAHREFFEMIAFGFRQRAPCGTRLAICFNSSFDTAWTDFEDEFQIRPRRLTLKPLSLEDGAAVMIHLARKAGLELGLEIVDSFLEEVVDDGGVSPASIGIGLSVFKQRTPSRQEFRNLGADGLIADYIKSQLARYGEPKSRRVLNVLANFETSRRFGEGRKLADVAGLLGIEESETEGLLDQLISDRLVERWEDGTFRLSHDLVAVALVKIAKELLPEAEQLREQIQEKHRTWQDSGRDGDRLLRGKLLRSSSRAIQSGAHSYLGSDLQSYVQISRRALRRRWSLIVVIILVLIAAGSWIFYSEKARRLEEDLQAWGLPSDLPESQGQLISLSIAEGLFTHLDWVPGQLEILKVSGGRIESLENLAHLKDLGLSDTDLHGLKGLRSLKILEKLSLSSTDIRSLESLAGHPSLGSLKLEQNRRLKSLAGLERMPRLTEIELRGFEGKDLTGVSELDSLQKLIVSSSKIKSLGQLRNLRELARLEVNWNGDLTELGSLEGLPRVSEVLIRGAGALEDLSPLRSLPQLSTLTVKKAPRLTHLQGLEFSKNLKELSVIESDIRSIDSLKGHPSIQQLDLSENKQLEIIDGLSGLRNLSELKLAGCSIRDASAISNLPLLANLDLSGNRALTSLAGLGELQSLTRLNISGIGAQGLEGLKEFEFLISLSAGGLKRVDRGQFAVLMELPSLRILSLRDLAGSDWSFLAGIRYLRELDLSQNSELGEALTLLGSKNVLEKLTAEEADLVSLSALSNWQNLKELYLRDNPTLSSLLGLSGMPSLELLDIRKSGIFDLRGAGELPSIKTLDLRDCIALESLSGVESFPGLETLFLAENPRLEKLDELADTPELKRLNVSRSGILNFGGLEGLRRLGTIGGYNNSELTSLSGIENLPELGTLLLDGSESLRSFEGLGDLPKLSKIEFQRCGLVSLEGAPILTSLTTLNLRDCGDLESVKDIGRLFPALKSLVLSGTSVRDLSPIADLENLEILEVDKDLVSAVAQLPGAVSVLRLQ